MSTPDFLEKHCGQLAREADEAAEAGVLKARRDFIPCVLCEGAVPPPPENQPLPEGSKAIWGICDICMSSWRPEALLGLIPILNRISNLTIVHCFTASRKTMEQVIESSNNAFSEVCRVRDLIISEQQALVLNQQAMILRLTAEKEKSDRWIRRLAWVAGVSAAFALGMLIAWCTT